MKIAICLPSYNEADNICRSTKIIDDGLTEYFKGHECYIVNADNSSPDKTNDLFNQVITNNQKFSILEEKKGKGYNLINFFKFCKAKNIDFAATIDSDVKSVESDWVYKLIQPLIDKEADYVSPIYKRNRFEGSTTNHFVFPGVFAVCNKYVRQPIAGDFAFSKKFIEMILKQNINDEIQEYGIDIFMTLSACFNNLKIKQVVLGNKFHNPSFHKMEGMFRQVLRGYMFTVQQNIGKIQNKTIAMEKLPVYEECISRTKNFSHKEFAKERYNQSKKFLRSKGIFISKNNIQKFWVKYFVKFITLIKHNEVSQEFLEVFENIFFARATAFWMHSQHISARKSEDEIIDQTKLIFKEINV